MKRQSVLVTDQFTSHAKALRSHFEDRFSNPHGADAGRFVWDYWNVPGQYTALRTPAYHYFPAPLYRKFHEQLVLWGRRNLGCHDVSPPWLSCYVDGCRQELHADLPHGPWAFVFSLTPWQTRKFRGGETLLLQEPILDYWRNLDRFSGLEEDSILDAVEPRFNRLTVFDPRIPHGVRRVENVWDPREGRLVIHGWFVQPRPFIEGPLRRPSLEKGIAELTEKLGPTLESAGALKGLLSARFTVTPAGRVLQPKILSNTLKSLEGDALASRRILSAVKSGLATLQLEKRKTASQVTLPLSFE